jgi:hypothetical protein
MGMQPAPQKGGTNVALIIVIAIAVLMATGVGGCLLCTCLAARSGSSGGTVNGSTPNSGAGSTTTGDNWITSERPYVKFLAPPGWNKNIKGDWGVFKSPDGAAVFAFTTFNQPGESTTRLVGAASVLGVSGIDWRSPAYGTVGKDRFNARMAEGSCNYGGPGGYIWYATVDSGTSDQILLIYTVSSRGTKADKDAALAAIQSLQRR